MAKCRLGIDDWNCLTCILWKSTFKTKFDCFNDNKYKYPQWSEDTKKEKCPMHDPEQREKTIVKFAEPFQ